MEPALERTPPNSVEAEVSVLGGLMLDPEAVHRIVDILETGDFYRPNHRLIFANVEEHVAFAFHGVDQRVTLIVN